MFIPLGSQPFRKVPPIATITIIALNFVAYALTSGSAAEAERRIAQAWRAQALIEVRIQAKHLELTETQTKQAWLAGLFGKRTDTVERFWEDFERGHVVALDDPDYVEWKQADDASRQALHSHVYYQWGYRSSNPNPLTILTSMFLHDGPAHLGFNMLFLWVAGVNLEQTWGRRLFLLSYLFAGVASTAADAWLAVRDADVFSLGASGAVAGVMGAFTVRHFTRKIRVLILLFSLAPVWVPGGVAFGLWFVGEVYSAFKEDGSGGVAFWAHVGGFAAGAAIALAIKRSRVEETHVAPQLEREEKSLEKARLLEEAAHYLRTGRRKEWIALLDRALVADPDDVALRDQLFAYKTTTGDRAGARADAEDWLRHLWKKGDRRAYSKVFDDVEAAGVVDLPAALVHRAGLARETRDPLRAAELYFRASQADAGDPVVPQALDRYAALLERMGAADQAAQVRAVRDARYPAAPADAKPRQRG